MAENIFSESWHLVCDLKVSLLYSVETYKQFYRGETWYVLNDKYSNKFYRITPKTYNFLMKLNLHDSVEKIWETSLIHAPKDTPNQNEVVKVLMQLHANNLLFSKNRVDIDSIFTRFSEKKQKEFTGKLISFLFIKLPIWNPEKWLENNKKLIHFIFSKKIFLIWLFFIFIGLKEVIDNSSNFMNQTQGILSLNNMVYLYLAMIFLKVFHEMGHAMMTKRFGGTVTTMGVSIIIFTPLPYVDASNSWAFQNKYHRILVGSAGMLVELFIAAIAAIVWANTGDGVTHSVAFNMMIIGSITSIFFNGNPLLKFDAYYMLSDWLEIPNLYQRSHQQIYYLVEKFIFSLKDLYQVSKNEKEASWLIIYAITSFFYKLLASIAIGIYVADQFFLLGVIVILLSLFMWVIKPSWTYLNYLINNQKLRTNRLKVISMSAGFALMITLLLFFVPFYNSVRADGVVESKIVENVFSPTEAFIEKVLVNDNTYVKKGEVLFILRNDTLDLDIKAVNSEILETKALILQATQENIANLKPLFDRLDSLSEKLTILKEKKDNLKVVSNSEGYWIANKIETITYSLIKQRQLLGKIINPSQYQFVGVITQDKATDVFLLDQKEIETELKLHGISSIDMKVSNVNVIPYEQTKLPSAVLGFAGGGDIAIDRNDNSGLTTQEAFFEVKADIDTKYNEYLFHDRSGVMKIKLNAKPLGIQLVDFIEKLLQKRYKI